MKRLWVAALLCLAGRAGAQGAAADQRASLRAAAVEVARAWHVELLVDPAIAPASEVVAMRAESLDAALDRLARQLPHAAWRRLRMAGKPLSDGRLAAMVRSVERLKLHPFIATDLAGSTAPIGIARGASLLVEQQKDAGISEAPVYLLFDLESRDDGRTPYERLAELQKQQWEMMGSMPASGRLNPMLQFMQMAQGANPGQIENSLLAVSAAGNRLYQSVPPDQRRGMMQRAGQTLNQAMSQAQTGVQPAARNWLPELKSICAGLSNRTGVRILVDPAMFVPEPPHKPEAGQPLDAALLGLGKPIAGAAVRRVELSPDADPKAAELAADLRAVDGFAQRAALAEDRAALRWMLAATPAAVDTLHSALTGKLSKQPVYILYSRFAGPPASPEERYAEMQRQQFQAMLTLDADHLTQAMSEAVDSFSASTPADQERMMGLPLMAALMGVWFPRAAKERMP